MSSSDWYLLWDDLARLSNEEQAKRLERHRQNLTQVTGVLDPVQLGPIDLNTPVSHVVGILELAHGGTNADFSGTGPGVVKQDSTGAALTIGPIAYPEIDWSDAGALDGQPLIYDAGGPTAAWGKLTLSNTDAVQGVLSPTFGGTGLASYAVGDLLYASGAAALSKLADVATGNALISGGVTTAPAWGKVGLTTHISGVLAGTNGGTGVNNGSFLLTIPATGTSALLGLAQTFSAVNTFSSETRLRGIDFGLSPASDFVIRHGTSATGTIIRMSPNGNGLANPSLYQMFNTDWTADQTNFELFSFGFNNNVATFLSQKGGTGTLRDMQFANANGSFRLVAAGYMSLTQFIEMVEIAAPAAGAANSARLFTRDNGAGKTQLCVIFNTGAIQVIATQP